jgi:hypothetical protein
MLGERRLALTCDDRGWARRGLPFTALMSPSLGVGLRGAAREEEDTGRNNQMRTRFTKLTIVGALAIVGTAIVTGPAFGSESTPFAPQQRPQHALRLASGSS